MSDTAPNPENPSGPVLPPKESRSKTPLIIVAALVAVALAVWGIVAALGGGDEADDSATDAPTSEATDDVTGEATDDAEAEPTDDAATEEPEVVRIGVTEISSEHWVELADLAAEEGIELEFVGFSEYTQPNPALAQGELELNSFQHIQYLANHNINTGDDLQPIGSTVIVPLPLYSNQYDTVEEFQPGDEVAIPNDTTNQARALFVLESAGLITFVGEPTIPTPDDVDTAASTVVVVAVEASQTATLIDQLAGVIVNNNFAQDAGFDLTSSVAADDPNSPGAQQYINVFASRPEDVDNPVYNRIAELYHSPEVLAAIAAQSGGTAVPVSGFTGEELRAIQARVESELLEAQG